MIVGDIDLEASNTAKDVVSNCIAAVNNILLFRDRDNDLRGKCATNRICDLCARALQEHPESESVNDYSASLIFGLFLIGKMVQIRSILSDRG